MAKDNKPVNVAKGKKKKWSKGKVKEKVNNSVAVDTATLEKLYKEVPTYKLVTVAILMERMKLNGSTARKVLEELEGKGAIKRVNSSHALNIYTRATAATEEAVVA